MRDWLIVPVVSLLLALVAPPAAQAPARRFAPAARQPALLLEGITFATAGGQVFLPVADLKRIGIRARQEGGRVSVGDRPLPRAHTRRLLDGGLLASVRALRAAGVPVFWDRRTESRVIAHRGRRYRIRVGTKRIVVNKAVQRLRSWQGSRLLAEIAVSTGRAGFGTPSGQFTAGPFKAVMNYSRIYDNAPMPWCTQFSGNYCIHGAAHVPRYPASHGCVRVPLTRGNPARWLWEWVDRGAAVRIRNSWS